MVQGRDSARVVIVLGLAIVCIMAQTKPTLGATYIVGDAVGWTFNVANWSSGKSFKSGDVLAFNYASNLHNVVQVSPAGYKSCKAPASAKVYQTGEDTITLRKGPSYFICTVPGHCQAGMKIAVNAA